MKSPVALRTRSLGVLALAGALVAIPGAAPADEKQTCSAAYDGTQEMRRAGHLQKARGQATVCMRDACAEFIRTDCAKWFTEIDAGQPTVIFDVKDARGNDTNRVRIALDGKPWLEHLDGKAIAIDPGEHTLRYETEGAPAQESNIQIRETEKNRKIDFSFQSVTPAASSNGSTSPLPAADSEPSIAPWIVGGVGVAGLIVGGVFGGLTLAKKSTTTEDCTDVPKSCSSDGHSAAESGKTFGAVSTAGFIIGGLGVGVSAVWLLTRKTSAGAAPTGATVGWGPQVTPDGARWRIEGSF